MEKVNLRRDKYPASSGVVMKHRLVCAQEAPTSTSLIHAENTCSPEKLCSMPLTLTLWRNRLPDMTSKRLTHPQFLKL